MCANGNGRNEGNQPSEAMTGVTLDMPNNYMPAKKRGGKPNIPRIIEDVTQPGPVMAIASVNIEENDANVDGFLSFLADNGVSPFIHHVTEHEGTKKASNDADVGFALAYLAFEAGIKRLVLVAGDGDYVGIVRFLTEQGFHVTVASFPEALSSRLAGVASEIVELGDEHVISPGQRHSPNQPTDSQPTPPENDNIGLFPNIPSA